MCNLENKNDRCRKKMKLFVSDSSGNLVFFAKKNTIVTANKNYWFSTVKYINVLHKKVWVSFVYMRLDPIFISKNNCWNNYW